MRKITVIYLLCLFPFIFLCGMEEGVPGLDKTAKKAGDSIQREVIPVGESILIEGFETVQGVGRGHAAAGINTPELRQTDEALDGQSAGLVESEGTMFGIYSSPKESWRGMYINIEEGKLSNCTGISFWVRSREVLEHQPINIRGSGSTRFKAFFSIPGDNKWHKITIPFFGDALHIPVLNAITGREILITDPSFTPDPERITTLDFIIPYNRPYSFAIDKLEGISAPAGEVPLPEVVSIREVNDDSRSRIEELQEYENLALGIQEIMWHRENSSEALRKYRQAQEILTRYVENWKMKYQEQKKTYSYQRGMFRLEQARWYNQIEIDRLEAWQKYPDGTVVEQTPFVPEQYREYPVLLSDITYMSDGLRITGIVAKPKGDGPFPLVMIDHGGGSHAKDHLIQVLRIASAGFVAFASDYRGHGGSEGIPGSNFQEIPLYGRDVVNGLIAAKTLPYVDYTRIGMWGHSMGGAVSWEALASETGKKVDVFIQVSSRISIPEEKLAFIHCSVFMIVGENDMGHVIDAHPKEISLLEKYNIPYEAKTYPGYNHHRMKFHEPLRDVIAFFQENLK